MIDDTWPDLSGWHPLPEGGTIPKGMRYAWLSSGGFVEVGPAHVDFTPPDSACYRYRTEHPVPVPLPTEEGARIIAAGVALGVVELTLIAGRWRTGAGSLFDDDDIAGWMPATEWRER